MDSNQQQPSASPTARSLRVPNVVAFSALPVAVVLATIVCEYLVRTGTSFTFLAESGTMQFFTMALHVARLLAAGMALATWTWFAGALRFEDAPSATEAIGMGWSSALRCIGAVLPLWVLSLVAVFLAFLGMRLMVFVFAPVGAWAVALGGLFVASCVVPLVLFVAAKYVLVVPMVVFGRVPPFAAAPLAGAHMRLRSMAALPRFLATHAVLMLCCVLVPSWGFVADLWPLLSSVFVEPRWIAVVELAALALFSLGAPMVCASAAALYFHILPPAQE